ncbi:MAG TPA: glycosyltransferase family 39 protein, partial [Elusimicrobiota bacterium]|nr:glycosyltransferase family 39 protein [Elusimicrobiota bacterium]
MKRKSRGEDLLRGLCLAAIAAGILLRFLRLGQSLWFDEAITVRDAALPLAAIPGNLARVSAAASPPLFYFLLHAWLALAPAGEAALRLLPAVFGALGVLAVWAAGERWLGRAAGLSAAAVLALHPFHIAYSQELRPYALLVLLSIVSFHFFLAAQERGRPKDWACFAAATLANLYTQYYAGFLFAAQAAWLGPRVRGAQRRRLAACAGAVLAGFAPWLPGLWRQTHKHVYALLRPADLSEALNTLYHLFGVKVSAATWATYGWRAAAPALLALQLAVWAWALARARGKEREPARMLLGLAAITLAIPFALSLRSPIYMGGRYAI